MLREKGRLVVPKPVKKSTKAERNMRARIRAKTKLGEDKYKRLRDRYNMLVFGYISWVTQKKRKWSKKNGVNRSPSLVTVSPVFWVIFCKNLKNKINNYFSKNTAVTGSCRAASYLEKVCRSRRKTWQLYWNIAEGKLKRNVFER